MPVRVAMVVPTFPQISETFIAGKALGLTERGLDIHIVCTSSPPENWAAFGPDHPIHAFRDRVHVAPTASRRPAELAQSAREAARVVGAPWRVLRKYLGDRGEPLSRRVRDLVLDSTLIRLDPDVVHFEFGTLGRGRMGIRDRLDAAVTVSFRGFDLNYAGLDDPEYFDPVWTGADRVHLLGEDLWHRALRRGAPLDLPHTLIPPALDVVHASAVPARPGRLGDAGQPLRVLSVGRLHWKKGYEYALDAVAALKQRGIVMEHRIVGDGELLSAVAFWRHQLGLDDDIMLLRSVPPAEVANQLRWADVFLHAATSEGFCNGVIEAQAHGVPVVTSDADGLSENVESGVTGFVVPRRDPRALAAALESLAVNGDLRAQMGEAGSERAARLFRLEDQLDAWKRFYRDAVEHAKSIRSSSRG